MVVFLAKRGTSLELLFPAPSLGEKEGPAEGRFVQGGTQDRKRGEPSQPSWLGRLICHLVVCASVAALLELQALEKGGRLDLQELASQTPLQREKRTAQEVETLSLICGSLGR